MRRPLPIPLLSLLLLSGCLCAEPAPQPVPRAAEGREILRGEVVGVTDGDTIEVLEADERRHRVRLQGIDSPERAQAYARAATRNLSRLVFGKRVAVQWEKRDRYGRIVGKVLVAAPGCPGDDCPETLDVNLAQIEGGLAWWYRHFADEQTPEDRARYEAAEARARARRIGLWKDPSPLPPWEFRRPRGG